jgi:hypothetical protein
MVTHSIQEVFVRHLISTAVTVLAAGLSVPAFVSTSYAAAPVLAVPAPCSITTPSGGCYSAGEFCSKAELGKSTTAADGEAIHCVQDGQFRRWLSTGATSTGGTSTAATGSTGAGSAATGQAMTGMTGMTGTGMTTAVVPLRGVAAGGGGLALATARQATATPHSTSALPVGLAAGAFAAGVGGVLLVRKRRAADGR